MKCSHHLTQSFENKLASNKYLLDVWMCDWMSEGMRKMRPMSVKGGMCHNTGIKIRISSPLF